MTGTIPVPTWEKTGMTADNSIAVVGAGPAGMIAAIVIAKAGGSVTIYEKNRITGKKLRITGKGRCNVTNNCAPAEFLRHVTKNEKFLYGAINRFTPEDTMEFFEGLGIPLKTERGRRVFPESDRADDIADALEQEMRSLGVNLVSGNVDSVGTDSAGQISGINVNGHFHPHKAVIIATGGVSYPRTGSTGDGYRIADDFGLDVNSPRASLVPIVTVEDTSPMMGLTLKNVVLTVNDKTGNKVFSEQGELLFTHFGISGPLALSASAHMRSDPGEYNMEIDMKCALDDATLDRRIISDLSKNPAKAIINSLGALLPSSIIGEVVKRSGIDTHKQCSQITRAERAALAGVIKHFSLTPSAFRPVSEAIVTSGGVSTAELSPRTMMAKKVPGLFFAGEVIDVDAYTGGYNLQIAFSTGYIAGEGAFEFVSLY